MTNSRSTGRALLTSALAVFLCVAMLIGTTFAWFTDTASTSVNKIQAGTLDVGLEMYENDEWVSAEGRRLNFVKAAGHESEAILWEPGCTYELPKLRIVNNGNLALKYKVVITGINGNAKLNEVIDWTIGAVAQGTEQKLVAGANNEFTISGHMKETAGNEYQGLTIKSIAITVYATQDTVEYDSTTNQYDANATYYINTEGSTTYNATNVTLDNYTVEHEYKGAENDGMTFYLTNAAELNVNDMEFSTTVENDTGNRNLGFYVYNGSKLTVNSGNFTMDGRWNALIWGQSNSARNTVTINGGTFTVNNGGNSSIISAYSNTDVYITGGFFDQSTSNPNITLQWNHGSTMTVTGGTFVNYNPKDHNAVPAGYTTVALPQSDGKTWYKVVPVGTALVSSVDDLNTAMTDGNGVVLTDDITADATQTTASGHGYGEAAVEIQNKVFDGEGNTLTVTNANNTWDSGIITTGGTIKNVTIKGPFRGIFTGGLTSDLYIDNVVLDNVTYTFSADASGYHNVVFTNSTLNGWTSYTDGFASVSFTDCKFGESRGYSYCRPYSNTTFTNCTFAEGYEFDATQATSTFVNCYVGTTLITADNVVTLLGADATNVVINNR